MKQFNLRKFLIILGIVIGAIITVFFLAVLIFPQTQKKYAGSIPGGPE